MATDTSIKPSFWLIAMLAVLALLIYFWLRQAESVSDHAPSSSLLQPLADTHLSLPAEIHNPQATIAAQAALAGAQKILSQADNPSSDSVSTATPAPLDHQTKSAWQVSHQTPAMTLPQGVVVYQPVNVTEGMTNFPTVGEQVKLTLPEGESVLVQVASQQDNANGDYTWRGYLQGHGDEYPVVMTYGKHSVFATITTPQGSYSLESVNGSGWVYKNPSEFELSAPGKLDYLEVPHLQD